MSGVSLVLAGAGVTEFFGPRVQNCLADLDLPDGGTAQYLTELLARFTSASELTPLGPEGSTRDGIAESLRAMQESWDLDGPGFDPGRELALRRQLGDYALFTSGFFWERARADAIRRHLTRSGRWAYRFLAAHHRAAGRPEARTYRLLSRGFDRYAGALTYLREIYLESEFAPWPHPSYVRVLRWD